MTSGTPASIAVEIPSVRAQAPEKCPADILTATRPRVITREKDGTDGRVPVRTVVLPLPAADSGNKGGHDGHLAKGRALLVHSILGCNCAISR